MTLQWSYKNVFQLLNPFYPCRCNRYYMISCLIAPLLLYFEFYLLKQRHFTNFFVFIHYSKDILSNTNPCIKYIANYSVPYNTWHLWHSKPNQVPNKSGQHCSHPLLCLDGIRFLTMNWIIYGHCIAFSMFVASKLTVLLRGWNSTTIYRSFLTVC